MCLLWKEYAAPFARTGFEILRKEHLLLGAALLWKSHVPPDQCDLTAA